MNSEKQIEQKACRAITGKYGALCAKLATPGQRGYPDRIFFFTGIPPLLIEFKRPGGKVTALQQDTHERLKARGYAVHVCDSVESALEVARVHWETRK